MPIPDFDGNLVIPPHLGAPVDPSQLSPYQCTSAELCKRFGTSSERRAMLHGLLEFRTILRNAGFPQCFHWLDGSFSENIEAREKRAPRDLDIVTFFKAPTPEFVERVSKANPVLVDDSELKRRFHLDHYFVDLAYDPILIVESTRYWTGLFSHRRDGVWKGMLRLELGAQSDDAEALEHLNVEDAEAISQMKALESK